MEMPELLNQFFEIEGIVHIRLFSLAFALLLTSVAVSQQPMLDRIEEDWELVVGDPDPEIDAPQVTTSMIPFAGTPDLHLQVNLNHALKPEFEAGGIQVRIVEDDELLGQVHRRGGEKLAQSSETVRWTSAVQKIPTGYSFGVSSGTSSSWGTYGGNDYFLVIAASSVSGSLEDYDYRRSLENSTVAYAGNRVQWLKLLRIRFYYSNGMTVEHEIQKVVE